MSDGGAGEAALWGGGADGSSASGGAGAAPVARWIDPDWLEDKCEDCECSLCFGVMVEPASGCPEGHIFCKPCYVKELRERKRCPACRHPVAGENNLVRSRPLESMIAKLRLLCEHAPKESEEQAVGPPAAKRAKLVPAASMTVEALREELRQRGLETAGSKPELEARLEEDRTKGAGCGWKGRVGELHAHLLGECQWAPVKCPNQGCTETPLRKDLPEHEATCKHRMEQCPNQGCCVTAARGTMDEHREECGHEEVSCPCLGCDTRLLRKDMDTHVHPTPTTSWVFNWRTDGWGGESGSETRDFGGGVEGTSVLQLSEDPEHSHYIGFEIAGIPKCGVYATFSILDKHDKTLCKVFEMGTAKAPLEIHVSDKWGTTFTPTAEEKAQSVRADGSIRLRAVVRLFLDIKDLRDKARSVRADGSIRLRAVVRLFLDGVA
ncbi:hypothetical protein T484DRAFT_1765324 [Baffinella frigidus]|nr:hypothetical protein T484DRAFT_1765324 [Cryptophyta sp. CCMP2293]